MAVGTNDNVGKRHSAKVHFIASRHPQCRVLFVVMLNIIMLSFVMLKVVMLSAVLSRLGHVKMQPEGSSYTILGSYKGRSITVLLTSCLSGLESAV